jgi:hypothetical protein
MYIVAYDFDTYVTSTALTYKVASGVYSVIPKVDNSPIRVDPVSAAVNISDSVARVRLIRVYNVSDLDIVQAFGGTILNIGIIPGFGFGGVASGQNQRGLQNNGLFEGGKNMFGTGHSDVIVTPPPPGSNQ